MLVTLAGHILRGRALHAHMSAEDCLRMSHRLLTHDIGYVHRAVRCRRPEQLSGRDAPMAAR